MNLDALSLLPGRCAHGYHATQRTLCEECTPTEWSVFRAAVDTATRTDGTVHVNDLRPLLADRIAPKHVGSLYRRAKAEGLLIDTGAKEPSTDTRGRNTDKDARIYRLAVAA